MSPITHPAQWSAKVAPSVVILDAPHASICTALDTIARRERAILADAMTPDGRHMVIADRHRRHRVWIRPHADPATASYTTALDDHSGIRLGATLQFNRWLHGKGPQLLRPLLVPTRYKRQRLVQLLRIADAEAEGAALRDIAYALVFPNHPPLAGAAWKGSSERRTCQRLAAEARRLIAGDYLRLLTG